MPYSAKSKLAMKGRDGDSLIAHMTPGDVVISRERQERDPKVREALRTLMGDDLERFTAGSAWNSKNPKTGLAEFSEGGGAGGGGDSGGGGDTGGGGGTDPGGIGSDTAGVGAGVGPGTGSIGGQETGTAAHAAEVGSSPAGDPSTAGGLAASGEQPGVLGSLVAGALSSLGLNTTNAPGLGLSPGINSNAVGTAASAAPGIGGLIGTAASATGVTNAIGEELGLATPERGLVGTLGDIFGGTGTAGPGPDPGTGLGPDRKGDVWDQIFAGLTPGAIGAPPPPQATPTRTPHKQEDAALLALQGISSNSPMSLEAARALLGEG